MAMHETILRRHGHDATKDGKIIAKYQGWAENKVALAGQHFEIR
jgi:hypothetical protein